MAPRLLIATTTWWPSVGVLASDLERAGFDVVVLCPKGHVATRADRLGILELDRYRPMRSLARALRAVDPDIVVPGDDRAFGHLRNLHGLEPSLRILIERSLGDPASFAVSTARVELLEIAAAVGFAVPPTHALCTAAAAVSLSGHVAFPWVLKVDGAWGGEAVRVAETLQDALAAAAQLSRGMPAALAWKRMLLNGDPIPWRERRARRPHAVSAQRFVDGTPATCALFAKEGELLGATYVEAVGNRSGRGPATLLRAVARPDVIDQARRLVRHLGLSGFAGLDFLVDRDGTAWLIEMNPRITGASRMRTASGPDPVTAAAQAFGCKPRRRQSAPRALFAAFPLAWLENPAAPELLSCSADLPWCEPAMLREALRPLWPERGVLAFLPARLRAWRRFLTSGQRVMDARLRPFSWWLAQDSLRPPQASGPGSAHV